MSNFITNIRVNEVFHLKDFDIPVSDTGKKHLIITGKNGSGKTVLLNAMIEYLEKVCMDTKFQRHLSTLEAVLKQKTDGIMKAKHQTNVDVRERARCFGKVELSFNNVATLMHTYNKQNFIVAYYAADRIPRFVEPKNPTKPDLSKSKIIRNSKVDQFLNFMVDLKVQAALAANEKKQDEADELNAWFDNVQDILRQLFEDPQLTLTFTYKDYSFHIHTQGKSFKFTELSAGYAAALDIVTDLIMKMQSSDSLTRAYEREGIVLIDEVETHLHLELQRLILPMLTHFFPNIQFVVTTHSPFVLSSLSTAVAYDLERRQAIADLTDYSYEALAEGYFGVPSESSDIQMRLQRLKALIDTPAPSESEQIEIEMYMQEFNKIPEPMAPQVMVEYHELRRVWDDKRKMK
jgi:predicted ATP-binding protein involved in virulence